MTASYEFLRLLEHRLQLQRLKRTHLLPEDDDDPVPAGDLDLVDDTGRRALGLGRLVAAAGGEGEGGSRSESNGRAGTRREHRESLGSGVDRFHHNQRRLGGG